MRVHNIYFRFKRVSEFRNRDSETACKITYLDTWLPARCQHDAENPYIEFPKSGSQLGRPVLYCLNQTGSAWSRPRDVSLSNSSANARGTPNRTVKWLGGRSVVHLCSTLMCSSSCVGIVTAPGASHKPPVLLSFARGQAALHCSGLARVQPWATAQRISKLDWSWTHGCRGPWPVVVRIPVKGWASALVAYSRRE